jgi:tetratricopeptide (TPR) repeat protein
MFRAGIAIVRGLRDTGCVRPDTHRDTLALQGSSSLGERVRELRLSAGLTQSELAGDRCTKEYISQIEGGRTRPTDEMVSWLSARLGVDVALLVSGVASNDRARTEAILARAEALSGQREFEPAIEEFRRAQSAIAASGAHELQTRALSGEAWARIKLGEVGPATSLLELARDLAEGSPHSDLDRGEIVYRLGVAHYLASSIAIAIALFDEALVLVERSETPSDSLRAWILTWRSRCYRRQRDYEAAREDIERALEVADSSEDSYAVGEAYLQASLIAEREGRWVLARNYAERAKGYYEELDDRKNVARLLNNLGVIEFELGREEIALTRLRESFALSLDYGDEELASPLSSLAQVLLRSGDPVSAEENARYALRVLGTRDDRLDEVGGTQLVLGRALLDQGRLDEADAALAEAEDSLVRLSSGSHAAAAWIAQGDLARCRGDDRRAAGLFRRAAETLQDFRF